MQWFSSKESRLWEKLIVWINGWEEMGILVFEFEDLVGVSPDFV